MTPAPQAVRQQGKRADFGSLQEAVKAAAGDVPDGVYSSTAFMNYVKAVPGAKKFDASSLSTMARS